MTDKHTPGPWKFMKHGLLVRADESEVVGTYHDARNDESARLPHCVISTPNKRLIAAAPELLAALRRAEDDLRSHNVTLTGEQKNGYTGATLHIIRAAIAKAVQS